MAKQAKKVETPEAVEVEVLDENAELEKQVKAELKKYNVADAHIAALKKKYAGLKVKDIKDKEGLVAVKTALSDVVSLRTGIDKKRLSLTGDYRKIVDAINGEAKRLTALLSEVEEPLRAEKDRAEALIKAEKERKARELQERLDARVEAIKAAGMVFDGSFYVIGDTISMDVNTIRDMKDADFDFLKAKVELEAERIRKAKEEEEQRKAAEEARLKAEREKLEQEMAELQRQKDEMARQREEMERQQRELTEAKEKAEREERERQEAAERQRIQDMVNRRASELEVIGLMYLNSRKSYAFGNRGGTYEIEEGLLRTASEDYWKELVAEGKAKIADANKKEAEIIEAEKEAERQRIIREQEEAKEKAEQEEAARLAALPEVEKVELYIKSILSVEVPNVETPEIRSALGYAVNNIRQNASAVQEQLNKFKNQSGE